MPRHAYVVELKQNSHNIGSRSRLASLELPPPQKKREEIMLKIAFLRKTMHFWCSSSRGVFKSWDKSKAILVTFISYLNQKRGIPRNIISAPLPSRGGCR